MEEADGEKGHCSRVWNLTHISAFMSHTCTGIDLWVFNVAKKEKMLWIDLAVLDKKKPYIFQWYFALYVPRLQVS